MKAGRRHSVWIAFFLAIVSSRAHAEIHFDNFANVQGLSIVGNAGVSGRVLRLTPARGNQKGAVWFRDKQQVRSGFETTFQFQLTQQDLFLGFRGADGFAFVVQNSGPEALGGRGSAAGFGMPDPTNPKDPGIPWMIAVFFDTLRNPDEKDPSSNYIAIRANGGAAGMRWPAARLAFTPHLSVRLKDRKVHTTRVVFEPPVLSVFLDGSVAPVLRTVVDFSIATGQAGSAWVGFTAAPVSDIRIMTSSTGPSRVRRYRRACRRSPRTSLSPCQPVCPTAASVRPSGHSSNAKLIVTISCCPPIWNAARVSQTRPAEVQR